MEMIRELLIQINTFLSALGINLAYVGLFILAGYLQGTYAAGYQRIGPVWKTFLLGSLFSVVYVFLQRDPAQKKTWVEFFASYLFATSMYEMWIKDLANKVVGYLKAFFEKKLEAPRP